MRFFKVFFFCCLLSSFGFSQKTIVPLLETTSKPILKLKSQINVGGYNERIIVKRFLDDDSKLLAITNYGIKLWNVKTAELIKSYPHEIQDLGKFQFNYVISPDGTKAIVVEAFDYSLKKLFRKEKVPAIVYDLETGKQISILERPKESIRHALWTEDGKTLITFSNSNPSNTNSEISFWNGESLEFRGSFSTKKGIYLTQDGKHFITISPITENTFGSKTENQNSVKIWDLQSLKVEKNFPFIQEKSLGSTTVTPDEKFLITESNKQIILLDLENGKQKIFSTKDKESIHNFKVSLDKKFLYGGRYNNVIIWEIEGDGFPQFEIMSRQPVDKQHFAVNFLNFSDDGKYAVVSQTKYKKALGFIAYDMSDEIEYYNLETGQVEPNLKTFFNQSTSVFSADRSFGINTDCSNAVVYDVKLQQKLYTFPLDCKSETYSSTDSSGNSQTDTRYYNDDIIVFHPKKNISLVAKDNLLEIYSIDAEQRQLQKLFTPKDLEKKPSNSILINRLSYINFADPPSINHFPDFSSAGFLLDGSYAYAISKDKKSVIFWDVDESLIE